MSTPTLIPLLKRSAEFETVLLAEFPEGVLVFATQEPRHEVAAAAALIAIEHAGALRMAAQIGAMNSAAALLRLQYEAVLRAAWLFFAAGPGQVDKLTKPLDLEAEQSAKNVPGYMDMLIAVEKAAPVGLAAPLVEFNRYSRHALNSFVHAGIHPLTRTRAGFPVELAETVLRFSAGMLLALLSRKKNSQASNWDFGRKKDTYFRRGGVSPFALTTQVIDEVEWSLGVVNDRQSKLMSILENHWRLGNRMSEADWLLKNL